jgi:acyl-CoA reductase-like NAD-dependent aldehyde dehydrogenase
MITSYNPYTQIVQGEHPEHTPEETLSFLAASVMAFPGWSQMSFSERGKYLIALAELLKSRREELARVSTDEM